MAAISYTQVINSFVSTEGSNGIMTNYFYHTILVVYTNGTREIVTGQTNQISFLLPYVRTAVDEVAELKQTVKELRQEINGLIDEKMTYTVDSLFPIPDILGKNEVEALQLIRDAGLAPVHEVTYPASTPPNGFIQSFSRNRDNFKKVNIRIIHRVPDINGLKSEDALARLRNAGLTATVTRKVVSGTENDIVLNCTRADETRLSVALQVSSSIPETKGMTAEEARKTLEAAGCRVTIEKRISPCEPGIVTGWSSSSEKEVTLYVSIPEIYKAKYVDVKWTDMQDSSGDLYGATATFNNKAGALILQVSYTVNSKAKHQLTGISSKDIYGEQPQVQPQPMEPNTKGSLTITVPFGKTFEELPVNMAFTLETQFGLMKKKDPVSLSFALDW